MPSFSILFYFQLFLCDMVIKGVIFVMSSVVSQTRRYRDIVSPIQLSLKDLKLATCKDEEVFRVVWINLANDKSLLVFEKLRFKFGEE